MEVKEKRPRNATRNQFKDRKKVLISLNRDVGTAIALPDGIPVDKVPDGSHILPFIGTEKQIQRKLKQLERNPRLFEKYTVL